MSKRRVDVADVTGGQWLAVVGESHRQDAIDRLFDHHQGDRGLLAWALLVPERDNPADGNAVRVLAAGEHIGYLDRDNALRFSEFFDEHEGAVCPALIRGAPGRRGAVLRVDYALLELREAAEEWDYDELLWRPGAGE